MLVDILSNVCHFSLNSLVIWKWSDIVCCENVTFPHISL